MDIGNEVTTRMKLDLFTVAISGRVLDQKWKQHFAKEPRNGRKLIEFDVLAPSNPSSSVMTVVVAHARVLHDGMDVSAHVRAMTAELTKDHTIWFNGSLRIKVFAEKIVTACFIDTPGLAVGFHPEGSVGILGLAVLNIVSHIYADFCICRVNISRKDSRIIEE
jgi:hypothetical protein